MTPYSESVGTLPPRGFCVYPPPDPTAQCHSETSAIDLLTAYIDRQPAALSSVAPNGLGLVDLPSVPASSGSRGNDGTFDGGCWRHRFVCPSQGRYFGDRGSFVGFFNPLDGDKVHCVDNSVAPFGPMVVWHVMSTFACNECCEVYDDVLDEGVTSIPVVFSKDPFVDLHRIAFKRSGRTA